MLYSIARFLFRLMLRLFYRWRVTGADKNIPATGPVVLAFNHTGVIDPIVMGSAANRQVFFMAKEELFKIPILGPILPKVGAFPVRRGRSDREAITKAAQILREGKALGIFVEGTRSKTGEIQPLKPGAAMLAVNTHATIVPAVIVRNKGRLEVRFGRPIPPAVDDDAAGSKKERYQELSQELAERLHELLHA